MLIDYEQPIMIGGIIVFPDFAYANLPRQPGTIKDTVTIGGSTGGTVVRIAGSVGDPNLPVPFGG